MSYADAAASGPTQRLQDLTHDEYSRRDRAAPVPEVENTTSETVSLIDVDSPHISSVPSDFESQSVKTETQAERIEREAAALERRAAEEARREAAAVKSAASSAYRSAEDNPILVGNVVVATVLATVFGVGAYRRWQSEGFSWPFFGITTAGLAAIAVGDYFVSRFIYNRYPHNR